MTRSKRNAGKPVQIELMYSFTDGVFCPDLRMKQLPKYLHQLLSFLRISASMRISLLREAIVISTKSGI